MTMWVYPILFLGLLLIPLMISGFFISSKKMGFYVDAVSHSSMAIFTVLLLIFSVGQDLGPATSVWLAVCGVGILGAGISFRLFQWDRQSQEPWMGELFVGSLALSAIVISKFPLQGVDFDALFLGQLLLLKQVDLHIGAFFALIFLGAYGVYGNAWQLFFMDRELYRHVYGARRLPLVVLFFLMTALIGFMVQSVGLIFTFAVLIFPGRLAHKLSASTWGIWFCMAGGILILGIAGLRVGYVLDFPVGPTCALLWLFADLSHSLIESVQKS